MAKQSAKSRNYDAENIVVLEGLEPVRKRPGMYIGSTGPEGLHHLLIEIFDNSRDEAMAGTADQIEVALLPGEVVRVVDNGAGIPVAKHKRTGVSALETVMTTLHAGGKFDDSGYKISGGLHGVGASVVNALSEWTRAEVHRDGGRYVQEYKRGKKKAAVKKLGTSKKTGTIVTFKADAEIFSETVYSFDKIVNRMREQAYLTKGLRIRVIDARNYAGKADFNEAFFINDLKLPVPSQTFYFEGGLLSLVQFYNVHEKPIHKNIFYVEKEVNGMIIEIALQYVDDLSVKEIGFANNTSTPEGGTHITGFRTALTRAINDYGKKNNLLKNGETFSGDDVREGITAVVSVKLTDAQFEGQTKAKLGNVEARSAVEALMGETFSSFLEEHPDDAKAIISKANLALSARKAAKAAKDSVLRKGALEGMTLPGKLADCQTRKAEEAELFIVEGDSAGGTAKQGRDRRTQAILPLRGKPLNVERARIDKMLANKEIKSMVIALGSAIGDTFDISKLRYHKIIIATDADVDGSHIRTLLLTLFYRYFKPLIEAGNVYVAQPPLYKIKKGKEVTYAYTEDQKIEVAGDEMPVDEDPTDSDEEGSEGEETEEKEKEAKTKKRTPKISVQRYKGLGEMNAQELWETSMNPENRVLKQVTIDDAVEADKIFDILMGNEVGPRKSFIQNNAKLANLDI
ncbi:DNA topoisomerase IV subunit B [bacterium]|nr:DNA topoisomerase IV subunit B [bacterium]|tara:strand:+ start:9182 stop:11239 length:2058 start_codon:yes stop_codon:yes gene_type:complete